MADFPNVVFPQGGYGQGGVAHKGLNLFGHETPNFEIMEGMRFGQFHPAPYLPTIRLEREWQDYIVISSGKAVAVDSNNWLVPAGYRLFLAQKAATPGSSFGPQYTQTDVNMGIKNAQGAVPAVGSYVVDSMYAAGLTVGHVAGLASYDVYLLAGLDPSNPATFRFNNYKRQDGVAILTDYLVEFPVQPLKRTAASKTVTVTAPIASPYRIEFAQSTVLDWTIKVFVNNQPIAGFTFQDNAGVGGVDRIELSAAEQAKLVAGDTIVVQYKYEESFFQALWNGIAVWKGAAKPGDKVTINEDSDFVAYTPVAIGDTSAADESANILAAIDATLDIIGQVTKVDKNWPKQYLDRVKTMYDAVSVGKLVDGITGEEMILNKMPGTATEGMPSNIYFAGGDKTTGTVRFNLNIT